MKNDARTEQPWLPLWGQESAATDACSDPATKPRKLATAGLFAGIGGIELGLSRAGHPTKLLCEIDTPARAVLQRRFADVEVHDDVCTLKRIPRGTQLLAGGFPCQDLSQAGKTRGIEGSKSGLVGEVFRLVRKQEVPWLLLENVPFMLQLAKGQALEVIVATLESLGYQWAYRVVDTRSFGLPQRRRRVYMVASLEGDPRDVLFADEAGEPDESQATDVACGFYWTEGVRGLGWARDAVPTLKGGSTVGVPSPPAIWLPTGEVVTPDIRDAERLQGFRANWTKPAEEVARPGMRWKLVGNAVSVPAAKWLGTRLAQPGQANLVDVRPLPDKGRWPTAAWNVGDGRFTHSASEWPKRYKPKALQAFLKQEPKPLSERATAGFLNRTKKGNLRFPPGFLAAVERHLDKMREASSSG